MKIEEKNNITPRGNNPSMEMNEEHIPEEDLEKTIDNENREEIQQKGQKRKNPIREQEQKAGNQNKKRKETRVTINKMQNMKAKRRIGKQVLNGNE